MPLWLSGAYRSYAGSALFSLNYTYCQIINSSITNRKATIKLYEVEKQKKQIYSIRSITNVKVKFTKINRSFKNVLHIKNLQYKVLHLIVKRSIKFKKITPLKIQSFS